MTKPTKVVTPPEKKIGAQTPADPLRGNRTLPPAATSFGPASYEVLKTSFINGQIVNPGAIVQLPDGVRAGKDLKLVGGSIAGAPTSNKIAAARAAAAAQEGEDTQEGGAKLTPDEIKAGKREPSAAAAQAAIAGHKSADSSDPI